MNRRLLSVALAAVCCLSALAAKPETGAQKLVSSLMRKEPLRSGVCGMLAVTMEGDTVACYNHAMKMSPASNTKLITTGLALKQLGPDFRYETRIACNGSIQDSTLVGDIYIVGGGDPTTGSGSDCAEKINVSFRKWADIIRAAGIKRIEGRIVGDPRCFDCDSWHLDWCRGDLGWYYGAPQAGLNFFENAQTYYISPGAAVGVTPYVSVRYPETPWMQLSVNAITSKAKTSNDIYLINSDLGSEVEIRGSFPIDRKGYTLEGTNPYGAYTCAYYFHNYLNANGITVTKGYADVSPKGQLRTEPGRYGSTLAATAVGELKILGSSFSPRLADIAKDTNCESDNFYAEMLLHTLGATMQNSAKYDSCMVAASKVFSDLGVSLGTCQYSDGSGLSRQNYFSPEFFVNFLKAMYVQDVFPAYFASLPIPGGKGTLEYRMKDAPSETKSRIHMKSGSMNGVRCFSGYIVSGDGKPEHTIVFSVLTNNVTAGSYTVYGLLDQIILGLAAENQI